MPEYPPLIDEICERIIEAAREVIQDVYAENAKNYTGLETFPIEGLNVLQEGNTIFTYKGVTFSLALL